MLWNPSPYAFTLPFIDISVRWYSLFFAFGVFSSIVFARFFFQKKYTSSGLSSKEAKNKADSLVDYLLWFTLIGCILGARLGHVFFYDWEYFSAHPEEIFNFWNGGFRGLASHGGTIGILLMLELFYRWKGHLFVKDRFEVIDVMTVCAGFTGGWIRVGNFFNQEILGKPTSPSNPFAVTFLSPVDGSFPFPRHPVQLYEAATYFIIAFFCAYFLLKDQKRPGWITGFFFTTVFSSRLICEFFKNSQHGAWDLLGGETGQWLSIPFIFLGIFLLYTKKSSKKCTHRK